MVDSRDSIKEAMEWDYGLLTTCVPFQSGIHEPPREDYYK